MSRIPSFAKSAKSTRLIEGYPVSWATGPRLPGELGGMYPFQEHIAHCDFQNINSPVTKRFMHHSRRANAK